MAPKVDKTDVALKVGEKADASHLTPLHAPDLWIKRSADEAQV